MDISDGSWEGKAAGGHVLTAWRNLIGSEEAEVGGGGQSGRTDCSEPLVLGSYKVY